MAVRRPEVALHDTEHEDEVRRDRFHGVVGSEEVELVGASVALFAHRHLPPGNATGPAGVLLCPPILEDSEADYLRAVRLARELARQGLTTQRFHHRGTRYSDGRADAVTFAALVEDARVVAEHLRARGGVEHLGVVGFRLGALVAATVARECGAGALSVWQPVLDPHPHVEGLLARHGDREVLLGSPLVRDLLGSPRVTNLVDMVGRGTGRVQVVQLSGTAGDVALPGTGPAAGTGARPEASREPATGLGASYARALSRWEARGLAVDAVVDVSEDEGGTPVEGATAESAMSATAGWLHAHLERR